MANTMKTSNAEVEDKRQLPASRCGWCGAYEGTVDPKEPCVRDLQTGEYLGPHQFAPEGVINVMQYEAQ